MNKHSHAKSNARKNASSVVESVTEGDLLSRALASLRRPWWQRVNAAVLAGGIFCSGGIGKVSGATNDPFVWNSNTEGDSAFWSTKESWIGGDIPTHGANVSLTSGLLTNVYLSDDVVVSSLLVDGPFVLWGGTEQNSPQYTIQVTRINAAPGASLTFEKSAGLLVPTSGVSIGSLSATSGAVTVRKIEGNSAGSVAVLGGNVTFDGEQQTDYDYTGGTVVSGGVLIVGPGARLGSGSLLISGGTVSIESASGHAGGTKITDGILTAKHADALGTGAVVLQGGTLLIDSSFVNASSGLVLTEGSIQGGGALSLKVSGSIQVSSGVVGVHLSDIAGGAASLVKSGSGTVNLTEANNYTGGTVLNQGVLKTGDVRSLSDGTVTINGGSLYLLNELELAAGLNLNGGSVAAATGTKLTVSGTVLLQGGTLSVEVGEKSSDQPVAFIKSGDGTATVNLGVTYTGGTDVQGGVLNVRALGSGTVLVSGGTLNLLADLSRGSDQQLVLNRGSITSGSGSLTISGSLDARSGVVSANITGDGRVVKTGTGTVTLSGANSYTGGTEINGGVLNAGTSSALGSGSGSEQGVVVNGGALNLKTDLSVNALKVDGGSVTADSSIFSISVPQNDPDGVGGIQLRSGTVSANLSGEAKVDKTGPGEATLSGVNTYTGRTTVSGGTLHAASSLALAGGSLKVDEGGALDVRAENVSVSGITLRGGTVSGNGSLAVDGVVTAEKGRISAIISNATSASAQVVKVTGDEVTLSGANTYNGGTRLEGGVLHTASSNALGRGAVTVVGDESTQLDVQGPLSVAGLTLSGGSVAGSGTLSVAGTIDAQKGSVSVVLGDAGVSPTKLQKTTGDNVTLSGANTYSGGTRISEGVLQAASLTALGSGAVEIVGQNGGTKGTLEVLGDAQGKVSVAGLYLSGGNVTGNGTLIVAGTIDARSGQVDAVLGNSSAGSTRLQKTGSGEVVLNKDNTYAGGTVVQEGVLSVNSSTALGMGSLEVRGGALNLTNSQSRVRDGVLLEGVDSRIDGGEEKTLAVNGTVEVRSGNVNVGIADDSSAQSGARLVKTGGGDVTINVGGSYTGGTDVNGGVLHVNAISALGSGTVRVNAGELNLRNDLTIARDLKISGGSVSATERKALTVNGNIELTGGEIGANITGVSNLKKTGDGVATVKGENNSTGTADIQGGTLNVAALGAGAITVSGGNLNLLNDLSRGSDQQLVLNGGSITSSNGALIISGSLDARSGVVSANIAGDGGRVVKTGTGTVTLSGANSYTGGTEINGGVLNADSSSALGNGSGSEQGVKVYGGALNLKTDLSVNALTVNGGSVTADSANIALTVISDGIAVNSGTVSANLRGAATLIKDGSGEATIGGRNDYGGGTVINAGTLHAASSLALAAGTLEVKAGGTLDVLARNVSVAGMTLSGGTVSGNGSLAVDGVVTAQKGRIGAILSNGTSGLAQVVKVTGDEVTLSGANTYDGGTTVAEGVLHTASSNALGRGAVTVSGDDSTRLDVQGPLSVAGLTLNGGRVAGAGTLSVAGTIDAQKGSVSVALGDAATSPTSLRKTTGEEVRLSGRNTYSGGTNISEGVLHAASLNALGSGVVEILGRDGGSQGTLDVIGDAQGNVSVAGLSLKGGNVTGSGTLIVAGTIDARSGQVDAVLGNSNAESTRLQKTGSGEVVLKKDNTYAGGTVVQEGVLSVTSSEALGAGVVEINGGVLNVKASSVKVQNGLVLNGMDATVSADNAGNNLVVAGTIVAKNGVISARLADAIGGTRLIKTGDGEVTLNGDNTGGYAGGTTVAAGILHTAAERALGEGSVVVGGGELNLQSSITIAGDLSISGGSISGAGGSALTVHGAVQLNSGEISAVIAGTSSVRKSGDGGATLSGANTFTGGVSIDRGTLRVSNANALGDSGGTPVVMNGGTLEALGSARLTLSNAVAFNADSSLSGGALGLDLSGESVSLGGSRVIAVKGDVTISGKVVSGSSDASLGVLIKTGDGTLTLSNTNNAYAGGTVLRDGTLKVSDPGALGAGTVTAAGGVFDFAGGPIALSGLKLEGGQITASSGAGLLKLVDSGTIAAKAGVVNIVIGDPDWVDDGVPRHTSLAKTELGTLVLNRANTYSGDTVIAGGVVVAGTSQALGSGAIVLNGGTLSADSGVAPRVLSNSVVIRGSSTMDGASSVLVLDGSVQLGEENTLRVAHRVEISGQVLSGTLNKGGVGTLVLSGTSNTYAGGTNVMEGTLAVSNDSALSAGSIHLSGGVLKAQFSAPEWVAAGTGQVSRNISNQITITGDVGLNGGEGGEFVIGGSVDLGGGTRVLIVGGTVKVDGQISDGGSGAGGLVKAGSGRLVLASENLYSGNTEVREGELRTSNNLALGRDGVLVVSGGSLNLAENLTVKGLVISGGQAGSESPATGGTLSVDGAIDAQAGVISVVLADGSRAASLAKSGAGTVVLNKDNTYAGGTVIQEGVLSVNSSNALGTGVVEINGGALNVKASTVNAQKGLVLNGVDAAVLADDAGMSLAVTGTIVAKSGVISARLADAVGGTRLVKLGDGEVTISGDNRGGYAGGTTVTAGTLHTAAERALGEGAVVVGGGNLHIQNNLSIQTGLLLSGGSVSADVDKQLKVAGTIELQTGALTGKLADGTTAARLVKTGGGSATIVGAASYSGGTDVQGGVLNVNVRALGSGTVLVSGGTLNLLGDLSRGSDQQFVLNGGSITSSNGVLTISGSLDARSGVVSANITGDGGRVVKTGTGTVTLSGANSYTGGTEVDGGVLNTASSSALGNGGGSDRGVVVNGGALNLKTDLSVNALKVNGGSVTGDFANITLTVGSDGIAVNAGTVSANLRGSATLIKDGSGEATIGGRNAYTGGTTVSAGTLHAASSSALGVGSLTVKAGGALDVGAAAVSVAGITLSGGTVSGNGSLAVDGVVTAQRGRISAIISNGISASAQVVKTTSDEVTLSGTNTYAGGTTVAEGILHTASSSALGRGAVTVAGDESTQLDVQGPLSVAGLTLGGGSVVGSGTLSVAGTIDAQKGTVGVALGDAATSPASLRKTTVQEVRLSERNTYSGGTNISEGVLHAASLNALGSGVVEILGKDGGSRGTLDVIGDAQGNLSVAGLSLKGGNVTGSGTLIVAGMIDARSGQVDAVLGNSNAASTRLQKTGSGEVVLKKDNTYAGGTVVQEGVLSVNSTNALGTGVVEINGGTLSLNSSPVNAQNGLVINGLDARVDGEGRLVVSGTIVAKNGVISVKIADAVGGTRLIKTGDGEVIISGDNTGGYAGGTTVEAGILHAAAERALGMGSVVVGGGELNLQNDLTIVRDLKISGGSVSAAVEKALAVNGSIELTGGQIGAKITGVSNLKKTGDGVATVKGDNASTGTTDIQAGTLNVAALGAGTITVNGGNLNLLNDLSRGSDQQFILNGGSITSSNGVLTISGSLDARSGVVSANIAGDGGRVVKTGSGTLVVEGTANSYTGGTRVSEGVVVIAANSVLGTGTITLDGGALKTTGDKTIENNLVLTTRGGTLDTGVGTLTLNGAVDLSGGNPTLALLGQGTLNGALSNGSLTKDGTGVLTLGGSNNSLAGIIVNGGSVVALNANSFGRGTVVVNGGTLFSDIDMIMGEIVLNGGTLRGEGLETQKTGAAQVPTGESTLVRKLTETASLPVPTGSVLRISRDNSYTGPTTINGTVLISGTSALGYSPVTLGRGAKLAPWTGDVVLRPENTLSLVGDAELGAPEGKLTVRGATNLSAGTSTVALTVSGDVDLQGAVAGTLQKKGAGNLTLSASNAGLGNVSVSEGTISAGTAGALGYQAIAIGGSAKVDVSAVRGYVFAVQTGSGSTSATRTVTVNGALKGSSIVFDAGVELKGSGSVNSDVFMRNASLSPGNSPGTLTFGGTLGGSFDYNWQRTLVEANAVASNGEVTNGFDRVIVNGSGSDLSQVRFRPVADTGSAQPSAASIGIPVASQGLREDSFAYDSVKGINRYVGVIQGTFPADKLPQFEAKTAVIKVSFKPSDTSSGGAPGVDLVIERSAYSKFAQGVNSMAFASALDASLKQHYDKDNDSLGTLMRRLDTLIASADVSKGLTTSNAGASYSSLASSAVQQAVGMSGAVDGHLDNLAAAGGGDGVVSFGVNVDKNVLPTMLTPYGNSGRGEWTAWTSGYTSRSTMDADSTAGFGGNSGSSNGGMMGLERTYGALRIGVLAATGQSSVHFDDGGARVETDHWAVGGYGSIAIGSVTVDTSAMWGNGDQTSERDSVGGRVKGTFASRDMQVGLGVAVNLLPPVSQWQITPIARLKYVDYTQDAFEETGSGLAFGTAKLAKSSVLSKLGLKIAHHSALTPGIELGVDGAAYWVHDFNVEGKAVGIHLVGVPGSSFVSVGRKGEADSAQINLGVQTTFLPSVTLRLSGQQDFSNSRSQTTGVFSVALSF